jgi:two-component system NarL family sensor kinase
MQVSTKDFQLLIILVTLIFLIAPLFLVIYINLYNSRKKRHIDEKAVMKEDFEAEILQAQMEIREQTMQTIGSDLHDNIGQLLSLTNLTLKSVELNDRDKSQQKIDTAIGLTSRSIQELRSLGKLFQGEQLISKGLSIAINHELEWLNRLEKYQINYNNDVAGNLQLSADKELILFRLFQETLNNIIKHAEATSISVFLDYAADNLTLTIEDNGVGFNTTVVQKASAGMGLQNIHKRANLIGGEATIDSRSGLGTIVQIKVPY